MRDDSLLWSFCGLLCRQGFALGEESQCPAGCEVLILAFRFLPREKSGSCHWSFWTTWNQINKFIGSTCTAAEGRVSAKVRKWCLVSSHVGSTYPRAPLPKSRPLKFALEGRQTLMRSTSRNVHLSVKVCKCVYRRMPAQKHNWPCLEIFLPVVLPSAEKRKRG